MTLDEEIDAIKSDAQLESERVEAEERKEEPKAPEETKEPEAPKGEEGEDAPSDEGQGDEGAGNDEPDEHFGKPGHTPSGVQKRINELTSKTKGLESTLAERDKALADKDREIAELKRKMEGMREPTREDFLNNGKTEQDWLNHVVEVRSREKAAELAEKMREEEELKSDLPGFHESEELARRLFPDYDVVVASGDLPGTPKLSKFIRKEKVFGGQILYTLMKFPQERIKYVNAATEDEKLVVLKNLRDKLEGIANKFKLSAEKKPDQENNVDKDKGQKVEEPKPSQLREPTERQPGPAAKKKLNPSECSMEEWMTDGY